MKWKLIHIGERDEKMSDMFRFYKSKLKVKRLSGKSQMETALYEICEEKYKEGVKWDKPQSCS